MPQQNKPHQTNGRQYSELQDLGYFNDWHRQYPEIVKKCRELCHEREIYYVTDTVVSVACYECGYKYKIDSGD